MAGLVKSDGSERQISGNIETTEGSFNLVSSSFKVENETNSDYYNSILAHKTLLRRDSSFDDEYDELTEELVVHSLAAKLLTPVVSLEIRKPTRNRRSADPIKEVKFKFRRLSRPTKRIEMDYPTNLKNDLSDIDKPIISFFDGIVKITKTNLDVCFTLPQRR